MKRLKHRYQAFTILELIVVMLLTVLTISFSYRVYDLFSKMFLQYRLQAFKMTELTGFQRTMSRDIYKAERVIRTLHGIKCNFGADSVEYTWNQKHVLRVSTRTDTFHVEVLESVLQYDRQDQYLDQAEVDACTLILLADQDSLSLCFTKQYSVDQKLRYQEKYGHQENPAK